MAKAAAYSGYPPPAIGRCAIKSFPKSSIWSMDSHCQIVSLLCQLISRSDVGSYDNAICEFLVQHRFQPNCDCCGIGLSLSKGKDRPVRQRRDYGTLNSAFEGGVTAFSSGRRICDSHAYGTR